jgi:hypothetical protein
MVRRDTWESVLVLILGVSVLFVIKSKCYALFVI